MNERHGKRCLVAVDTLAGPLWCEVQLAVDDDIDAALQCAQRLHQAMRELDLEVRIGIHTGECELLGTDIGGIAVHIGARVGALAAGSRSSGVRQRTKAWVVEISRPSAVASNTALKVSSGGTASCSSALARLILAE